MSPEVLSQKPVNVVELKEELAKIKKRDKELNFRAEKTEEHLNQFVAMKPKEAQDLFKKLSGLNVPRLKEEHIHKIIDILPATPDEVKMVLQGYTITVTKDNVKKIADVVAESIK